jgi:hypothetical protein
MTAISRPIAALLAAALESPAHTLERDIERLRESVIVALRRCLDMPGASWSALVESAADRGSWDRWRRAGLLAAETPHTDETPDSTRETLAALAEELLMRRDILDEVWEGDQRQAAVESPRWIAGRERRELVFTIESAMDAAVAGDGPALAAAAETIERRDGGGIYPGLPDALRRAGDEITRAGSLSTISRRRLVDALAGTPFAAAAAQLPDRAPIE